MNIPALSRWNVEGAGPGGLCVGEAWNESWCETCLCLLISLGEGEEGLEGGFLLESRREWAHSLT